MLHPPLLPPLLPVGPAAPPVPAAGVPPVPVDGAPPVPGEVDPAAPVAPPVPALPPPPLGASLGFVNVQKAFMHVAPSDAHLQSESDVHQPSEPFGCVPAGLQVCVGVAM